MKVLGYARVSTEEQASEGVSLDVQQEKIAMYCQLHGLTLVGIEVDAGVSAKSLDRPGLAAALARLDSGEVEGLVITKLDRLSRSVADWNRLIDGHFGAVGGRQLLSVSDSIDTRTAAGRLVLNVLMSVAQWEREIIVERTREAIGHKRRQGERIGRTPVGKRLRADGKTLEPDPREAETVALILVLRAAHVPYRRIIDELETRGIPARDG